MGHAAGLLIAQQPVAAKDGVSGRKNQVSHMHRIEVGIALT